MPRIHRIVVLVTLVLIAPVISGCADFDLDKLDVFHLNEKKKLPGKRIPLFPNGVPGVSQGIPPEYMKGYQQQNQTAEALPGQPGATPSTNTPAVKPGEQKTAAATPVESKPKPKPKRKAKAHVRHKVKRKAKAKPKASEPKPVAQPKPQPAPWPAPPKQGTSDPWPAPSQSTTPNNSAWPNPPPTGTFSKQ